MELQRLKEAISTTVLYLRETITMLRQEDGFSSLTDEQDLRDLRAAQNRLNSLCVRIDAQANVLEGEVITAQLRFMQENAPATNSKSSGVSE